MPSITTDPTVTLNNEVSVLSPGYGVVQFPDAEECERSVVAALETGYLLIDRAAAYAIEEALGRGITVSGVSRDEVFLATSLWVTDASETKAPNAFERSPEHVGMT